MSAVDYDPPRPMKQWTVQATCPVCGHVLAHVADGRPNGRTSRALAACTSCGRRWMVEIAITETSLTGPRARAVGRTVS